MKHIFKIIFVILMCIFVTSCSLSDRYGKDINDNENKLINTESYENIEGIMDKGPKKGGKLKLFCTIPDTLNPLLTENFYVQQICGLIFDSLVNLDKAQKPVPVLCKDWEISGDGLRWTFNLRDDVMWHDNTQFTSEDVEFTLDIILKSDLSSYYKTNLQNIDSYKVDGKHSITLTLKKPNSFTAEQMSFPIISRHYYMGTNILDKSKNMTPVGTGAYRFVKFEGDLIKLKANDKWWNSSQTSENGIVQKPYIEEIDIKIYKDGKSALSAFQTKEVDIMYLEGIEYNSFRGRADLLIKEYTSRDFEFIAFNTKNQILQDEIVRRAIAYSLDRKSLVDQILPGKVVLSDIPVIPGSWIINNNADLFAKDTGTVKELLVESGWKEENSIFYKRLDGRKRALSLEILVNEDNEIRRMLAEKIKEQLNENGIELRITVTSWEDELRRISSGDFDIVLLGCRVPTIPDVSFLYSNEYLNSYSIPTPALAFNVSGYDNYNINTYIEGIFNENDSEEKKVMFSNMKSLLMEDVPYMGLFFYKSAMAYNKRIKGSINPYAWNLLSDITGWYIPEK